MPIRSGIGIGEAQVYDISGISNQYSRQVASDRANMQKQALLNEKRNDEFTKSLSTKLSSTQLLGKGLHTKDTDEFLRRYAVAQKMAADANVYKNNSQRTKALADLDNYMLETQTWVNDAISFNKESDAIADASLKNPYLFSPEDQSTIKNVIREPYVDVLKKYPKGFSLRALEPVPDKSALIKGYSYLDNKLGDLAKQDIKGIKPTAVKGNQTSNVVNVDPKSIRDNAALWLKSNNEAYGAEYKQWKKDNPIESEPPTFDQLTDSFVKNWELTHGGADKAYTVASSPTKNPVVTLSQEDKDAANLDNYSYQDNKVFSTEDVYGTNAAGDSVITKKSRPIISFQKFVTSPVKASFTVPQINKVINISTGTSEKMYSTSGLSMTGLGYNNGRLRATVVDKNDVEYAIDEKDIPASVKNSKQYKAALNKLKKGNGGRSSSTSNAAPTILYTRAQLLASPNSGWTNELIDKAVRENRLKLK